MGIRCNLPPKPELLHQMWWHKSCSICITRERSRGARETEWTRVAVGASSPHSLFKRKSLWIVRSRSMARKKPLALPWAFGPKSYLGQWTADQARVAGAHVGLLGRKESRRSRGCPARAADIFSFFFSCFLSSFGLITVQFFYSK